MIFSFMRGPLSFIYFLSKSHYRMCTVAGRHTTCCASRGFFVAAHGLRSLADRREIGSAQVLPRPGIFISDIKELQRPKTEAEKPAMPMWGISWQVQEWRPAGIVDGKMVWKGALLSVSLPDGVRDKGAELISGAIMSSPEFAAMQGQFSHFVNADGRETDGHLNSAAIALGKAPTKGAIDLAGLLHSSSAQFASNNSELMDGDTLSLFNGYEKDCIGKLPSLKEKIAEIMDAPYHTGWRIKAGEYEYGFQWLIEVMFDGEKAISIGFNGEFMPWDENLVLPEYDYGHRAWYLWIREFLDKAHREGAEAVYVFQMDSTESQRACGAKMMEVMAGIGGNMAGAYNVYINAYGLAAEAGHSASRGGTGTNGTSANGQGSGGGDGTSSNNNTTCNHCGKSNGSSNAICSCRIKQLALE